MASITPGGMTDPDSALAAFLDKARDRLRPRLLGSRVSDVEVQISHEEHRRFVTVTWTISGQRQRVRREIFIDEQSASLDGMETVDLSGFPEWGVMELEIAVLGALH